MKIANSFTIDAPVEQSWQLLTDISGITPCLPGANLSGEQDGVYSGCVKIKVGPVTAEYRGSAEFVERDDQRYRAVIDSQGRDSRGAGNAQALITAQLREVEGRTQVDLDTDLLVTGKIAQFSRGVLQDVSEKLVAQFTDCLAVQLHGTTASEPTDGDEIDLFDVAGGAVAKRVLPVAAVAILVIVLLALSLG